MVGTPCIILARNIIRELNLQLKSRESIFKEKNLPCELQNLYNHPIHKLNTRSNSGE